jgi:hypothetical protein
MALTLPNGSALAIASTYGASKNMTAVTNANPAVATLEASHGIIVGDVFEVTSGWEGLDKRIMRCSVLSSNDVTLEGFNASSTTTYPAGSGTGTIREISAWTALTQVLSVSTSGGDQQFFNYQFLEGSQERQVPTIRGAQSLEMSLGDDQSLGWYTVLAAASDARSLTALRITLPSGAKLYFNGYFSLNKTPTLNVNQAMALSCTFSLAAEMTRFAS